MVAAAEGDGRVSSQMQAGMTFVRQRLVVQGKTDQQVRVPIPVHVAGGRHGRTHVGVRLIALEGRCTGGLYARGAAIMDQGAALVRSSRAVLPIRQAKDQFIEPVPVHITAPGHTACAEERLAGTGIGGNGNGHTDRVHQSGIGTVPDHGGIDPAVGWRPRPEYPSPFTSPAVHTS